MPDILHRVGIAAEPTSVFEALTTVAGIRGWWSSDASGDPSEGGAFEFRAGRLEVLKADQSLVKWRYSGPIQDWVGTEIVFRMASRDGQTVILFSHEGWREPNEIMHHCSTKWAMYLVSLKDLVEKGDGRLMLKDVRIAKDLA